MIKESEYFSKVIEAEFNKPLAMTEKGRHEDLITLLNVGFVKLYVKKVN